MGKEKPVRKPNQLRSRETKEKIMNAADRLFGEIGYHKTNTKLIAREAGVPVGSVYAYFKDKKHILLESVNSANERILTNINAKPKKQTIELKEKPDIQKYLRDIIETNIDTHKNLPIFHRDMGYLRISEPEIDEYINAVERNSFEHTKKMLCAIPGLELDDIDAAAVTVHRTIESFTHYLTYEETTIEKERIIKQTVKMLTAYLSS